MFGSKYAIHVSKFIQGTVSIGQIKWRTDSKVAPKST